MPKVVIRSPTRGASWMDHLEECPLVGSKEWTASLELLTRPYHRHRVHRCRSAFQFPAGRRFGQFSLQALKLALSRWLLIGSDRRYSTAAPTHTLDMVEALDVAVAYWLNNKA
jgi:hypothetical protein